MSLKQEIETWVAALGHYDNNEFEEALKTFADIPDTSKILFNCGVIHATLGEHTDAVACFQRAVRLDQYLAVAYFQQGVSNFLVGDFEEALANFNDTLLYLRGNNMIDYAQLGLMFKLYSCEVLFNRGLCYIYLQQKEAGMQDFSFAVKEKVVEDHNVIDEAITEEAEGYTVFSIPVGVVYRPNAAKVKNLKTKDYLGKARLVAASDAGNTFTGFAGSEIKHATSVRSMGRDDRPLENLSFAAANLVKPGLSSKRQQSEPPLIRNLFPPTPPPESERAPSASSSSGQISRGTSVHNGDKPIPPKLNIEKALPSQRYEIREEISQSQQRQQPQSQARRLPTARAASESRGPQRREGFGRLDPPLPLHRRRASDVEEGTEYSELYNMYRESRGARSLRSRPQQDLIEEEEEDGSVPGFNANDFEMLPRQQAQQQPHICAVSRTRRGSSKRPEIHKVRVLVHGAEDNRYVMVATTAEFIDLQDKIRDKFQLKKRFKLKIRDDDMPNGDMITMGDQDDLEMAMASVKENARRESAGMGKLEVWIHDI